MSLELQKMDQQYILQRTGKIKLNGMYTRVISSGNFREASAQTTKKNKFYSE